jgi:hypothetical protein
MYLVSPGFKWATSPLRGKLQRSNFKPSPPASPISSSVFGVYTTTVGPSAIKRLYSCCSREEKLNREKNEEGDKVVQRMIYVPCRISETPHEVGVVGSWFHSSWISFASGPPAPFNTRFQAEGSSPRCLLRCPCWTGMSGQCGRSSPSCRARSARRRARCCRSRRWQTRRLASAR